MRAAESLREAQADLAHVNRVTTMGELGASIAHEVNQPITGVLTSALTARRSLARGEAGHEGARRAIERIIRDATRAGDVIGRIRDLVKKAPPRRDRFDLNGAIRDVIELSRSEAVKNRVAVSTRLEPALPLVDGDKVQLQQVILNLAVNAIEAMSGSSEGPRELRITSANAAGNMILVTVQDSGPGLDHENPDRVFQAFYTTKPTGLGMGLSICRSIIEGHSGRLWASANAPRGAIFHFTLPDQP
jgi:C4-dicarboxylate-specific signal transduction histidine kinase